MRQILIAVCDTDRTYGQKLGEWLSLEKGERMRGCSFSVLKNFLEFQEKDQADVVLLGSGFWEEPAITAQMKETAAESGSPGTLWIYLADPGIRQSLPELAQHFPVIRKYQAASQIIREICFYYQKFGICEQQPSLPNREILGIYSPSHSIWQTPFALTLAQALSLKEKVLYVNFRECAGFEEWLGENYTRDLLDVMYLCLTGEGNISECVGSGVYALEGFDYIPPAGDSGCLGEVTGRDYLQFVRLLAEKSGYEVLVLDLGMMVSGFFGLLELCSKVYVVSEPGELQGNARKHFKRITAKQDNGELVKKISYLQLPKLNGELCRGEKMQQWIWGELGDYTRRIAGVQGGAD